MILGGKDVLNKASVGNFHDTPSKLTQDDQVTSAPKAVRVSIKTAVWIVLKDGRLETKSSSREGPVIHVQTTRDAGTSQRLGRAVLHKVINYVERHTTFAMGYLGPHIHESWHFTLQTM
jgi:hypothetical protein